MSDDDRTCMHGIPMHQDCFICEELGAVTAPPPAAHDAEAAVQRCRDGLENGWEICTWGQLDNLARAHLALIAERDALLKYARHLPSCELAETDFCTCGYKEALAAARAQPAEEKQP